MKRILILRLAGLVLIGLLVFSTPAIVWAQDDDPPPAEPEAPEISDGDILIFEPQLYLEFPFNQGFKITLNFGVSFEVPRRLTIFENNVLDFFLKFKSFVRFENAQPDAGSPAEPTPTPTPEPTPTPDPGE